MQQLILPFKLDTEFVFSNFYNKNNCIVNELKNTITNKDFLKIIGDIGKTHLLQAVCHFAKSQHKTFYYIPLKQFINLSCDSLEFTNKFDILCIDDIHLVAGKPTLEKKIFNLFNDAYDTNCSFIVSTKITDINFTLADLNSRINGLKILKLPKLNDDELQNALILHAKYLGIILDKKVIYYIFNHLPRNLNTMMILLKKLSSISLLKQRKITISLIKEYYETN